MRPTDELVYVPGSAPQGYRKLMNVSVPRERMAPGTMRLALAFPGAALKVLSGVVAASPDDRDTSKPWAFRIESVEAVGTDESEAILSLWYAVDGI